MANNKLDDFINIYQCAQNNDMNLKAHVGEFSNAEEIIRYSEALNLNEIHHGVKAANSKSVMNYLRDHNIVLNMCPSSNLIFGLCDSSFTQLKTIIMNGITITINSDDQLVFNSSVSNEYYKLFLSGNFTPNELNDIRIAGIQHAINQYNIFSNLIRGNINENSN